MEPMSNKPPLRPWRDIAREVAREQNRFRILELSRELDEALEAQTGSRIEAAPRSTTKFVEPKSGNGLS